VNGLVQVLREHAASPEEGADVRRDWTIDADSLHTKVTAYAKVVAPDQEGAWRAAVKLRDAIVGLGYELRCESELGAISEEGSSYDSPIPGWRGFVKLRFATGVEAKRA
jgi:hypothetical protein